MRDEYDFSKAEKNPYTRQEKQVITIRLDYAVIEYFRALAAESKQPYQTLINSYLLDCVKNKRHPIITWK